MAFPHTLFGAAFDRWLNRITNLAVLVIGAVVVMAVLSQKPPRQPERQPDYRPGDVVDMEKLGLKGPGLIMVTRSTCPACNSSLPFYRELSDVPVTAVAAESPEVNRIYLTSNGIKVNAVIPLTESGLKVGSVPTLIVLDGQGRVRKSWRGRLNLEQEREVAAVLKGVLR